MRNLRPLYRMIFIGTILFAAASCDFPPKKSEVASTPTDNPTQTPFVVTATSIPGTLTLITQSSTEIPTSLVLPSQPVTHSPTPKPPASLPAPQTVLIYLIALEDHGVSGEPIGCGDSLVPVTVSIAPTQGVLRAALESLLRVKESYYGQSGLYNALYQSNLQIVDVRIESGLATLQLTGSLLLGGVCDNPRVEGQLMATARQFSTVQKVEIFVNGRPLDEILSLK